MKYRVRDVSQRGDFTQSEQVGNMTQVLIF